MKKISLIAAFLLTLSINLVSQVGSVFQPGDYRDGIYDKENSVNRRFIPYTFLRQADVMWEKRVWRDIDLREKINQPLYYPIEDVDGRTSLLQSLKKALFRGEIIAFGDEEFLSPMTLAQIREKLVKCDSIEEIGADAEGNEVRTKTFKCDSTNIYLNTTKYRLKEDWFFDKQKSVLEVRILGLCPMKYDEAKDVYYETFWVYFPACRQVLATNEVFNTKNDAERRTFDDIFFKRQFNSFAIKETNVYDRGISEYTKGIDALLESDRIKNDIFQFEHDLWHF
ncbi:MAG TPA: gliding motility protein GldN [Bacteroidia bacterium]|jgi:gliding motility associated protien GldN|nr:gliding motility protein GldN [Bacteroidia bacterium]